MKRYFGKFLFLLTLWILPITDGLVCYWCTDSTGEEGKNLCQKDIKKMAKYRDEPLPNEYSKNCTEFDHCIIEKQETQGDVIFYRRGCSNYNSYNVDLGTYPRLANLTVDNQTHCAFHNARLACVTLCSDDYCNGPSGSGKMHSDSLLILSGLFILIYNFLSE